MIRLVLALCVLTLASCGTHRINESRSVDVRASYLNLPTDAPTLPRAFQGRRAVGQPFTADDLLVIRSLGLSVVVRSDLGTAYNFELKGVHIESDCTRAELVHECVHAGQVADGLKAQDATEAGPQEAAAMLAEVAMLMAEGWSDDRIRGLGRNNAQTPDWVLVWIRTYGPRFTGDASDMAVAYAWGRDHGQQVRQLVGAP